MSNCPRCNSPDAYIGFIESSVECINKNCVFFSERQHSEISKYLQKDKSNLGSGNIETINLYPFLLFQGTRFEVEKISNYAIVLSELQNQAAGLSQLQICCHSHALNSIGYISTNIVDVQPALTQNSLTLLWKPPGPPDFRGKIKATLKTTSLGFSAGSYYFDIRDVLNDLSINATDRELKDASYWALNEFNKIISS